MTRKTGILFMNSFHGARSYWYNKEQTLIQYGMRGSLFLCTLAWAQIESIDWRLVDYVMKGSQPTCLLSVLRVYLFLHVLSDWKQTRKLIFFYNIFRMHMQRVSRSIHHTQTTCVCALSLRIGPPTHLSNYNLRLALRRILQVMAQVRSQERKAASADNDGERLDLLVIFIWFCCFPSSASSALWRECVSEREQKIDRDR